jgi:hypothetical protein
VVQQALGYWMKQGHTADDFRLLQADMRSYRAGQQPCNASATSVSGALDWWLAVDSDTGGQLAKLTIVLFQLLPLSAEPERVFSSMGWYHGRVRSRLSYQATADMTKMKFLRQSRDTTASKRQRVGATSDMAAGMSEEEQAMLEAIQQGLSNSTAGVSDFQDFDGEEEMGAVADAGMADCFEALAGALSMDERLNAAAEQQVVLRFSYMARLMGEYGDAPLDFWGQGSGAVPTAAASGLAFVGNAAMPLQQQQAVLGELLAGED